MEPRRWRWDQWLLAGPVSGALALGSVTPLLFLVGARVNGLPPGASVDLGTAVIAAASAAMLGTLAGLAAGIVCAVITVPVEWVGRPTRRFYTWLAVGVTAVLGTWIGALGHGANAGLALLLFPIAPVCVSAFAAYWAGAWVWSRG